MASTSFAPELNQAATRPRFNSNPETLFDGGSLPSGWTTTEPETAVAPGDETGPVVSVVITNPQSGLEDGTASAVATTTLTGSGTGLKVDVEISSGQLDTATVQSGGNGYQTGDTVSVNGYAGTVLTVTI